MTDTTIKELADELGVTKQAIRKHLEKLPPTLSVTRERNTIFLDTAVTEFVRSKVTRVTSNSFEEKKTGHNPKKDTKTTNTLEIEKILNEQLKIKDKQLAEKDKQMQTMQKLLDQQQQLSLQTNKQINQLQLQLSNETEKDWIRSTNNQGDDVNEVVEKKGFFSRLFKKSAN